jgi:gliding motility associated protien GldN
VSTETVREADAVWSKRVWQFIDLREKINHPLYFPIDNYDSQSNWVKNSERWSLWTILKTHILNGDLKVFMTENPYDYTIKDGDQLKYPLEPAPGKNFYTDSIFNKKIFPYFGRLEKESITPLPSLIDGTDSFIMVNNIITYVYPEREKTWLTSQDVIQYHLKEDWFFDKERSVMDVRIIAIAPVVYSKDLDGQITGTEELFWLYFPHCRYVLNNYYAFNEHNDAQWMSYDDLFWKRKFSSVIYKESNVFDRKIETYKNGLDALLEADKIKEEIRTIEHDVWSF